MHSDTAAILLMGNFKEAGWSENHPSEFFFQDMIVFSHKLSSIKEKRERENETLSLFICLSFLNARYFFCVFLFLC